MASNTLAPIMYDGSTNPASFVEHFRLQALFQGWDSAAQLTSLPLFLRGQAKENYDAIVTKTAINDVLNELIKICAQPREVLLDEFFDRKLHHGESVSTFAKALKQLLSEAEPTMPNDNKKTLILRQLSKALPQHMQTQINFHATMPWNELLVNLDKSMPITANTQPQRWDSQTQQQIPANLIKTEPVDANINWLNSTSNASGRPPSQNDNRRSSYQTNTNSNNYSRFSGNCNYCNRFGHKEADCRTKAREEQQDAQQGQQQQQNVSSNGRYQSRVTNNNNSYNNTENRNGSRTNDSRYNRQPQRNQGSNSNLNQNASSHTLELDENRGMQTNNNNNENTNTNNEFPFYAHLDTTTVEMNSIIGHTIPTPLMKVSVHLTLFNQEPQVVSALIDGGSSHSFISPSIMTKAQLLIAADHENSISEKHNFLITSATGTTKSACSVTKAQIQIAQWIGEHTFVISGAVTKHAMIIGRDFFVKNKVIVNHSDNSIIINNMHININTICAISSELIITDEEENCNTNEFDDNKTIFTKFDELKKEITEYKRASDKLIQMLIEPSNQINSNEITTEKIQLNTITIEPYTTKPTTVNQQTDQKLSSAIDFSACKVLEDTVIRAQSQRLVKFSSKFSLICATEIMMFEPNYPCPEGCLIARSINERESESLYCNVLNSSDLDVTLKKDRTVGVLSEAEIADEQFDQEIQQYKPLEIHKLAHFSGKTSSSVPLFDGKKSVEITTADIKCHEIKNKIKLLKLGKSLEDKQRSMLSKVLEKNIAAFQFDQNEIGRTNLIEHRIPTGSNQPIQQRQYPIPSVARDNMSTQVVDMLKNKIIRHSNSSWRSPVMLVKKKKADGSIAYRFCVDLKQVNDITTKDCYSLPRISETVDALSGCKFFTTMDIDRAYWQVGIAEDDKPKTAFAMDGKLFEFNVMPFGGMNASATFQRLMDRVLRGLTWKQCLVYIDDILIFSRTFEDHLRDIDEVLSRFITAKLKLKPQKCTFGDNEVEYLGFKITDKGLQITNSKVEAILQIAPPTTTKNL